MRTIELSSNQKVGTQRFGLHLALVQLVFTLLWTTYVIYLPRLAADVGIAPGTVILILMMDQAIFTITDTAMGIIGDRIARLTGRLGTVIAILTAISCLAFVALPFVAGQAGPPVFIGLIVIWSITSSALRAPPLVLLGQHAAKPRLPWFAALAMLGYGVAGAAAPYLGVALKEVDARLPFIVSSAVLLLTALALARVGNALGQGNRRVSVPDAAPLRILPALLIAATVVLALGFQLHFSINSQPLYLRFAPADDLPWLMPVFWIGFNLVLLPASAIVKHRGGLIVMGIAGLIGAVAIAAAEMAVGLTMLIAAQFASGAAWGCMMMAAISAALAIGANGCHGRLTGLVFSALALATFARMAAVAGGLQKLPDYAPLVQWAPAACWAAAGCALVVIAAARLYRHRPNI